MTWTTTAAPASRRFGWGNGRSAATTRTIFHGSHSLIFSTYPCCCATCRCRNHSKTAKETVSSASPWRGETNTATGSNDLYTTPGVATPLFLNVKQQGEDDPTRTRLMALRQESHLHHMTPQWRSDGDLQIQVTRGFAHTLSVVPDIKTRKTKVVIGR